MVCFRLIRLPIRFNIFGYFWWSFQNICLNQFSRFIHNAWKLNQKFENWIFVHFLFKLFTDYLLLILWKYLTEYFFVTNQRIHWASFSFLSFEEIFSSRVKSLIRIFSWPTTSSSTGGRIPHFSIWSFRMLLFHMSI